jgi:hypothetical protein
VAAIPAALDMTTQGGRTAVLDGRHHLELAQAHMPGIGTAPGGAMLTKTSATSSLGRLTAAGLGSGSRPPRGQWREPVERAGHVADRGVGDPRVTGRGVELGMAERTRAIMRTFYVIETESSAERDSMLAGGATLSARDTRPGPPP